MNTRARPAPLYAQAWAVLRVRQWLLFAPLPAAGIAGVHDLQTGRVVQLACAMAVSGLSLAYAYGLNAITDRHADRDAEKNVLAGREQVPTAITATVYATAIAALLGSAVLGPMALGSIAASLTAGTVYSAGPRLKRYPWIGLFANLMIFVPLLVPALRSVPPAFATEVIVFSLLLTQNQLLHEQGDAEEDEAAGDLTTARWLGARRLTTVLAAVAAAVAVTGAFAWSHPGSIVCVLGGCASAAVSLARTIPAARRRRLHRYLSLLVGLALFTVGLVH